MHKAVARPWHESTILVEGEVIHTPRAIMAAAREDMPNKLPASSNSMAALKSPLANVESWKDPVANKTRKLRIGKI